MYNYGIAEIEEGEWLNYTRTFPKGDFIEYLRQAQFSIEKAVATLERVTGATDEEDKRPRCWAASSGASQVWNTATSS